MADVIAMMSLWQMLNPLAVATYCMADVIANVADGITTAVMGIVMADVNAMWQME